MADSISLVQNFGPECCPSQVNIAPPEPSYPSFHYTGEEDLDLPESGEMTVKFRVRSETRRKNSRGEIYECQIELLSIEKVNPTTEVYKRKEDAGDFLDKLMAETAKEKAEHGLSDKVSEKIARDHLEQGGEDED